MEIIWKIKTYSSIAASLAGYREKLLECFLIDNPETEWSRLVDCV